jgi:5-methylcytosine-specific restriction endonuclease McrA
VNGDEGRVIDEKIYKLLEELAKKGIVEINPIVDLNGVSYPQIEEIFKIRGFDEVYRLIEELIKREIFKPKLIDKIIRCPNCGGFNVLTRYHCPYCGSFNTGRTSIISHISCGAIDSIEVFRKDGKIICPRCGKELNKPEVDYRILGEISKCNSCGRRFDSPVVMHKCSIDKTVFSYREANYVPIYSLTLSDKIFESVIKSKYLVTLISNILREGGFQILETSTLPGLSGIDQKFDIAAFLPVDGGHINLCVNILSNTGEFEVLTVFSRVFDVKPAYGIIVSLSEVPENAYKLARSYGIEVIVMDDFEKLKSKVNEFINRIKNDVKAKKPGVRST